MTTAREALQRVIDAWDEPSVAARAATMTDAIDAARAVLAQPVASDDLTRRLRNILDGETCSEAADAIDALRAEVERLQRELGECQSGWETGTKAIAENERLRADAERYRCLREDLGIGMSFTEYSHEVTGWLEGEELDAAIDAALRDEA